MIQLASSQCKDDVNSLAFKSFANIAGDKEISRFRFELLEKHETGNTIQCYCNVSIIPETIILRETSYTTSHFRLPESQRQVHLFSLFQTPTSAASQTHSQRRPKGQLFPLPPTIFPSPPQTPPWPRSHPYHSVSPSGASRRGTA